jgi:beta propeller repeat protein
MRVSAAVLVLVTSACKSPVGEGNRDSGPCLPPPHAPAAIRITDDPATQRRPAISGDRIVWQDYRNGNWDIYLHDLATGSEIRLTDDAALQWRPAISGDRIVWEDYREKDTLVTDLFVSIFSVPHIYLLDLAAQREARITTGTAHKLLAAISGERVVWQMRNRNWDIYLYDVGIEREIEITTEPGDEQYPAISGDRIVWVDDRDAFTDIYLYNLRTHSQLRITDALSYKGNPAISGERIVWVERRKDQPHIYLYDLSTESEIQITGDSASLRDDTAPGISGDLIVWQDDRNGNWDIYLYDLATQRETRVTDDAGDDEFPTISGDRIVWEGTDGPKPCCRDIYFADVSNRPSCLPSAATASRGES